MKTISGVSLIDHTVDTESGIYAGFRLRSQGSGFIGFVWTQAGVWHWRSESGNNFGERGTKAAAVQALVDACQHYAKQRGLPFGGDGLIARAKAIIGDTYRPAAASTPHKAAPAKSAPPAPKAAPAPRQQINWGAAGSLNRDEVAAAFKKQGSK